MPYPAQGGSVLQGCGEAAFVVLNIKAGRHDSVPRNAPVGLYADSVPAQAYRETDAADRAAALMDARH